MACLCFECTETPPSSKSSTTHDSVESPGNANVDGGQSIGGHPDSFRDTVVHQDGAGSPATEGDAYATDTAAPTIPLERLGERCAGWEVTHALTLNGDVVQLPDVTDLPPGVPGHVSPFAYGTWTLVADATAPELNVYCLGSALLCGREWTDVAIVRQCDTDSTGYCVLFHYMTQCLYRVHFMPWQDSDIAALPAQSYRCVHKVSKSTGKATSTPSCLDTKCEDPAYCTAMGYCATVTPDDGATCYVNTDNGGICCQEKCVPLGACEP